MAKKNKDLKDFNLMFRTEVLAKFMTPDQLKKLQENYKNNLLSRRDIPPSEQEIKIANEFKETRNRLAIRNKYNLHKDKINYIVIKVAKYKFLTE